MLLKLYECYSFQSQGIIQEVKDDNSALKNDTLSRMLTLDVVEEKEDGAEGGEEEY